MSRNCTASEMEISMLRERVSTLETLVTKLVSVTEKHNTALRSVVIELEKATKDLDEVMPVIHEMKARGQV